MTKSLKESGDRPLLCKVGGLKLAHRFILTIQIDLEDNKIRIIVEGVRNVLLSFLEDMEETDHYKVS